MRTVGLAGYDYPPPVEPRLVEDEAKGLSFTHAVCVCVIKTLLNLLNSSTFCAFAPSSIASRPNLPKAFTQSAGVDVRDYDLGGDPRKSYIPYARLR